MRETARSYDRIVDGYEQQAMRSSREREAFRDRFGRAVPPRAVVLDAGCGPGLDTAHFVAAGLSAVGLDASPGMAARTHRGGLPVVVGDLRRLPFRPSSFDGIWCSASLLHVTRHAVPAVFEAFRMLLRPGGVLGLITSLGPDEGWETVPYEMDSQHRDVPLQRWFVHHDRDALEALVRDSGLSLQHVEERIGHRQWLQLIAARAA